MTINKITRLGIAVSLFSIFTSCDNVDVKDRYEITDIDISTKTLLIFDFTGNGCVNCPKGAAAIHSIQEAYNTPDTLRVIAVGLHPEGGGPNTRPIGNQDLRCQEAQVMYEIYTPKGFPTAVFNGTVQSSSYSGWFTEATAMLTYDPLKPETWRNESKMNIVATTDYNASNRNLNVNYTIKITKDISDPLNVMVWIMENGIVGYQMDGGTLLEDYVHNHVLRASLNGPMGEKLPSTLIDGDVINGSAQLTLDEKWVASNCQIVVYVYNSSDYFVEQATLADIN